MITSTTISSTSVKPFLFSLSFLIIRLSPFGFFCFSFRISSFGSPSIDKHVGARAYTFFSPSQPPADWDEAVAPSFLTAL